ncbi:uncharacterized protein LOC113214746 [Frankliniella occidentalis]|uniref:Uncharacterized protein LOC113214746 n=1 Tax=Frankliniella occidentalis TaxID=133901 RepID=A0A9C6TWF6_FRAOC|nr:uncharacterized protein LOC113214746 [Frankliniella occidentalis]
MGPSNSPSSSLSSSPGGPPCLAAWNCVCCNSPWTLCRPCKDAAREEWAAELRYPAHGELERDNDAAQLAAYWEANEELWETEAAQVACIEHCNREDDLAADLATASELGQ